MSVLDYEGLGITRGANENPPTDRGTMLQSAALTTCVVVVGSDSLVLSPILHDVALDLSVTPAEVSLAMAAFGGTAAVSSLLLAPLIDRMGPRAVLYVGIGGLLAATLLSMLSLHRLMLVTAQALAGLAAGAILPSTYTFAAIIARPGRESRVLGQVLIGWSIALVAGAPGASLVSGALGWRAVFLILSVLTALALFGISGLPRPRGTTATSKVGVISVLAALGVPGVPILLLICLFFMSSAYGVYAFIGEYAQMQIGPFSDWGWLILLAYGFGFGVAGCGDGVLDKFGPKRALPLCLAMIAITYALMVLAQDNLYFMIALATLWGFGNHFALNCLVLLLSQAKPEARGLVLSLNSATTYMGVVIGVTLGGAAYSTLGFASLPAAASAASVSAAVLATLWLRQDAAMPRKKSAEVGVKPNLNEMHVRL